MLLNKVFDDRILTSLETFEVRQRGSDFLCGQFLKFYPAFEPHAVLQFPVQGHAGEEQADQEKHRGMEERNLSFLADFSIIIYVHQDNLYAHAFDFNRNPG
jgi:hypothetical protein